MFQFLGRHSSTDSFVFWWAHLDEEFVETDRVVTVFANRGMVSGHTRGISLDSSVLCLDLQASQWHIQVFIR